MAVSAVLAGCLSCSSESPTETEPPTLPEQLQAALQSTLESYGGTGVSAAVLIPGEQPWADAGGISHGSRGITPQMLFGVSSITKSYVAALVLDLAEQGQLTLEDSLHRWLPTMEHVDTTATIRQLLNHTSGIHDFVEHPDLWPTLFAAPTELWTPEEVIATFVNAPYFAPGLGSRYSNTGYLLLGMIAEEATGSRVSGELRSRFWSPLNLSSTFLDVEEEITGELAHAWNHLDGDGIPDDLSAIPRTAASSATWTAGAVFSTAEDLVEWTRALFQGDVLSESSLHEMLAFNTSGFGLGTDSFGPEHFGARAIGLAGSGLGYSGVMAYLQDYDASIAVLMNDNNLDCLFATVSALVAVVREHMP
ncbi:serine hydrolase domain-containing protein [Gemmatimonadota bacterium]